MRARPWLVVTALVFLAGAVAGLIWILDTAAAEAAEPGLVAANGRLDIRHVRVSAATGGRVLEMRAVEGVAVSAGDTLALLDARSQGAAVAALRAAVSAAEEGVIAADRRALALESQLSLARLEARRYRRLFERDAAPRQAAERAEAAVAQLENELAAARAARALAAEQASVGRAQLRGARVELDETIVQAPSEGVVSEILVHEGEMAAAGLPILVLLRPSDVVLRVYLPLVDAERVRPGESLRRWLRRSRVRGYRRAGGRRSRVHTTRHPHARRAHDSRLRGRGARR